VTKSKRNIIHLFYLYSV